MPDADTHEYNPAISAHRKHLAAKILQVMATAGFIEEAVDGRGIKERVFYRFLDSAPNVRVQVYTSIEGVDEAATVRAVGDDSIKVCAVYRAKDGKDRGIISITRIHRTGTVEAICERLLSRMREVYGKARRPNRCNCCNAPTFKSKKGNEVCADLCFTR